MTAMDDGTGPRASHPRRHLLGEPLAALRAWLVAEGQQRYRADQIAEWIYARGAETFAQMTNLSKPLRAWLEERAEIYRARIGAVSASEDGTRKLLLTWPDGASIETVWIPDVERNTVCVSSQVGCPVGCRFCASGMNGVQRDLTAGEMVEQALRVRQLIAAERGGADTPAAAHLTNVVLMGMGEPLANYDAVVQAIRILNAPWGLNIGARKITLSTIGLPKQIRRLADEGLQLNLALSLHAPDQALRQELIPGGRAPLEDVLAACRYYFERTGREVTLEYVLLDNVNVASQHAVQLAKIARSMRCNVNLLRYNPVPGLPFGRPSADTAYRFQRELREHGVNAHMRTSRGRDIDAACGQLRRRAEAGDEGTKRVQDPAG